MMAEGAQVPLNRTEGPLEAPTDLYNAHFPNLLRPSRPNSRQGTLDGAPAPPLPNRRPLLNTRTNKGAIA